MNHPSHPYTTFGLSLDPEKFEGGGCGSFGATLLIRSGIFGNHSFLNSFWRTLTSNSDLFGYGLKAPDDTIPYDYKSTGYRKISKEELLGSNWNGRSGPQIRILDPEMFLLFLKTIYRSTLSDLYEHNYPWQKNF